MKNGQQETKKDDETVRQKFPIDTKTIAVILLIIAAVGIGYHILSQKNDAVTVYYDKGELADSKAFASNLQSAGKVFIVMDLRGASEQQKNNIMQCGTDFAGSEGLVGKELVTFAIENDGCTSLNGTTTANACITEAVSGIGLFIRAGNQTAFFKDKMVIGIGETYKIKDCRISVKKPQQNQTNTSATNTSAVLP